MSFGSWDVNVQIGKMPQKVATAFSALNDMVGAEYNMIAYLGSQQVNGVNHAVLAEQLLITGKDTKNIVLVIFRETNEGVTLANIERIIEGGEAFGGINIDVKTDIPEEAIQAFNTVMNGFVGSNVKPFALLATQVVAGTNYIFAAEQTPVVKDPKANVSIITVNSLNNSVTFQDVFKPKVVF